MLIYLLFTCSLFFTTKKYRISFIEKKGTPFITEYPQINIEVYNQKDNIASSIRLQASNSCSSVITKGGAKRMISP